MKNNLIDPELLGSLRFYGTIALDLTASTLGGFLLGRLIDSILPTRPWGLLIGPLAGFGAGFYGVYILVMQEAEKNAYGKTRPVRKPPAGNVPREDDP